MTQAPTETRTGPTDATRDRSVEERALALVEAATSMCAVIANRGLLVEAVSRLIGQHLGARCEWIEEAVAARDEAAGDWRGALRTAGAATMPVMVAGVGGRLLGAIRITVEGGRGLEGVELVALAGLAHTLALTVERLGRDEVRAQVLQASEREAQRWLSVLEAAGHGAWEWNVTTGRVTYSRQWKAMLGYGEEEVEDHLDAWSSRIHPDDLGAAMGQVMRHLEGKTPFYSNEHRLRCKDGSYRWILDLGKVVVRDGEGRPILAVGTHTDVTERKRAEVQLAELEMTHAIAESIAHLGSWRWVIGTGEIHWSAEIYRIFGVEAGHFEPRYESFMGAVHEGDREAVAAALERVVKGEDEAYDIEHRIVRPDGEVRWVRERGQVSRVEDASPVMSGMVHDITEVRRHQRRLGFLARRAEVLLELQSLAREQSEDAVLRCAVERLGPLVSSGRARLELLERGPGQAHKEQAGAAEDGDADARWPVEVRIMDGGRVRMKVAGGPAVDDADDDRETLAVVGREVWRLVRGLRDETARREAEVKFRAIAEQSVAGIYLVSERRFTWINRRGAAIMGYEPDEVVGRRVHEVIAEEDHVIVEQRAAQRQSGGAVAERVTLRAKHRDGREVLLAIGSNAIELDGKKVIVGVVQDVSEEREAQARARDYLQRLERSVVGTLEVISRMMSLRDPYTSGHERRVGEIAAAIGRVMGLPADQCAGLRFAGLVHDVGKITAPAEILSKPGRLTPTEYALIKTHAEHGYEILAGIDFPWPVAEVARQHHERMDGSGYPDGRVGEAILLEARIVAVADVVESMGSHRPYRPALGIDAALAEIERGAGRLYDPAVAAACVRLFRDEGYALPM